MITDLGSTHNVIGSAKRDIGRGVRGALFVRSALGVIRITQSDIRAPNKIINSFQDIIVSDIGNVISSAESDSGSAQSVIESAQSVIRSAVNDIGSTEREILSSGSERGALRVRL